MADKSSSTKATISSKVVNANRAQPLDPQTEAAPRLTKARIEATASDTVLNAFSILGEVLEDFKNADRFFKYKAGVLSTWFMLTALSFVVACPGSDTENVLNAQLVIAGDASRPVYMIQNAGNSDWNQIEVLVNHGAFKSTLSELKNNGGNFTLSGAVLYTDEGVRAPSSLKIDAIEVRVRSPKASVLLMNAGQPTQTAAPQ